MKPQEKPVIGENVSRIVRILLARDEMRQQDLAEVLGYDPPTITRALNGQREWKLNDLVRLAEFFEVSVSLFFEDPNSLVRVSGGDISTTITGREWADNLLDNTLFQVAA